MAVDDAQRRDFLRNHVTSDLQYVWEDSQVSLDMQYRMAQHYTSLRVFIALAETAAELRTALRTDFQMDPTAGAEQRAELARVVSSWLTGRQLYEKETELTAESKVMGMPRNLQHSERLAMVKAVETVLGALARNDTPSAEYLALKVEECENGEITASTLDEVTSKAHKNTSSLQTSLDPAGHVRVVKNKTKGALPANTEEYRQAMKLESITWMCMSAKFKSKSWLSDLRLEHFTKFTEYILTCALHQDSSGWAEHGAEAAMGPGFTVRTQVKERSLQAGEPGRSNSCGSTSKSHQGCRPQGILFHHTARPHSGRDPCKVFTALL